MDISRRLIGASAVLSPEHEVIDVDVEGLVRRLILFDKYVLVSVRLQEFPLLVKHLGYEGLRDLLSAKLIEVRCECMQLAQMAQSGMLGDPVLPLFSYKFNWIDAHDRKRYIHDCLQCLHGDSSLQRKQAIKLKSAIISAIRPLPEGLRPQLFPAFREDLLHNRNLLRTSVSMAVHIRLGESDIPFSLDVHQEDAETFRVETDLPQRAKLSELEAHKIIEKGIMAIAGLTQTIGEMKAYSAVSGFRDADLPLFRYKLDFLANAASSETRESNFQRVIDIAGFPDLLAGRNSINIESLLKIRDSSEAREFRDWLGGIGEATEEEIKDRIAGLRAKVGVKIGSEGAKTMRFLATAALGLIPPATVPAIALSIFDQFVLDKLLPRSGIAAFVNELYPSIFEKTD